MSLFPCTGCNERQPGKYANVTVAWWNAENKRVAYRLKLCTNCFVLTVHDLDVKTQEAPLSCPTCGQEPGADMDPVYITAFIPDYGKRQLEIATCSSDATGIRIWAREHGALLQDTQVGGLGPGPQTQIPVKTDWSQFMRGQGA